MAAGASGEPDANVAAQQRDPESLLSCYRRLLALRREQPALHAGALVWIEDRRLPRSVVAFKRVLPESPPVEVFLNFSRREVKLRLANTRGREIFSNRRGERRAATDHPVLGAYEGLVVLDRA